MSSPKQSVAGLRLIVAGGATGVGAAVASYLAAHGALIIIGDIAAEKAVETATSISASGGKAVGIGFDFTDEDSVRQLIENGVKAFGGLDGLINIGADTRVVAEDVKVLDMDPAIWRRTLDVNLVGYALTTKHALPHLFEQGGGAIVNISSLVAWMPEPSWPAYAASKAGVHVLTRHTASTAGHKNVRANAVSLGIIATEPVKAYLKQDADYYNKFVASCPLKRPGELEEAASLIEYLVSRESTFITGQVWGINGGVMMRE